ncbi:MAG: PAS domain-containing protein, partial [Caulobacteraceae bacterium]|nr:PAS domain-containing protein [Caulobacteraceae bacterium]
MIGAEPMLADISLAGQIIDIIPSPIFYRDVEGRYLGCNSAFEKFTGLRREDVIGKTIHEVWPKDIADVYQAADSALLKKPGLQSYEAPALAADGSLRDMVMYRTTFLRADGGVGGIAGVAWDITDRTRAERSVLDQLRFVEQLIETIPSPAFYKDAEGRYLGCNRAFEVFCGLKREDLIGKTV